jgi:hypothetical protein
LSQGEEEEQNEKKANQMKRKRERTGNMTCALLDACR